MSTEHDVARSLRSWLRENRHEDADRVLDAVFDQVPATPQRGAGWLARRFPPMNSNFMRVVVAAAAVVVVVLVGLQFVGRSNVGGPGPSPSASESPSVEPTATPPAIPAAGPLAIGRHSFTLSGVPLSLEVSTTGWTSNGDFGIDKGLETAAGIEGFILWLDSAADNTFSDPCSQTKLDPPAGPSIADRAAAVAAVPGVELVSGPTEVTVGGHPAQQVVITIPSTIGCTANAFFLWYDADDLTGGSRRYATAVGSTIYTWIIDVDGTVVWIDGETPAGSDPQAAQELQDMVDSIQFE
jgi:hypothetical protein